MWRARTAPLEIVVVGSPAVGGTWADPGWRREARLTPGYGEVAALRHQTEARRLWRSKVWRDATCYSKRCIGGTDPATATPKISPLLSPPHHQRETAPTTTTHNNPSQDTKKENKKTQLVSSLLPGQADVLPPPQAMPPLVIPFTHCSGEIRGRARS